MIQVFTENTNKYIVPHCNNCERCKSMYSIFDDYYCCEKNNQTQIFGLLGDDYPPTISPKWCPKRKEI